LTLFTTHRDNRGVRAEAHGQRDPRNRYVRSPQPCRQRGSLRLMDTSDAGSGNALDRDASFRRPGTATSDLAVPAAQQPWRPPGLTVTEIDYVVFAHDDAGLLIPGSGLCSGCKLGTCARPVP